MKVGRRTDTGLRREQNEDNFYADPELGLFIVADGIGGHKAGARASSIAVEVMAEHVRMGLASGQDAATILEASAALANVCILSVSLENSEECEGMGTTVVAALITGDRVVISHAGDSRAYMIEGKTIRQLTQDHTFVAEWVKEGIITPEEARTHEARSGLYMAVGVFDEFETDTAEWPWNPESCLVLCTDGLTDMLLDSEILSIVTQAPDVQQACDILVQRANEQGGDDNVTVVVVAANDD